MTINISFGQRSSKTNTYLIFDSKVGPSSSKVLDGLIGLELLPIFGLITRLMIIELM